MIIDMCGLENDATFKCGVIRLPPAGLSVFDEVRVHGMPVWESETGGGDFFLRTRGVSTAAMRQAEAGLQALTVPPSLFALAKHRYVLFSHVLRSLCEGGHESVM